MPGADANRSLLHPLFLDVSMLTGLLAQLGGPATQGGWAPPDLDSALEILDRWPSTAAAGGGSSAPSPTANYVATGLLQVLLGHLGGEGLLTVVRGGADLAGLVPGDLVEVRGACVGNPFEDLLGFYGAVIPQLLQQEAMRQALLEQLKQRSKGPRTRVGATASAAQNATEELIEEMSETGTDELAARLILGLVDDVRHSPVRDVVLDAGDHAAVLTVRTDLLAAGTLASLRGLRVRAVGKVAAVASDEVGIDLAGRTMFGTLGGDLTSDLVQSAQTGPYEVAAAAPVVPAPAVHVLPLAVLV